MVGTKKVFYFFPLLITMIDDDGDDEASECELCTVVY